jgi:ribulose 1,5-bisphosphate synthetase/thiazole synthase
MPLTASSLIRNIHYLGEKTLKKAAKMASSQKPLRVLIAGAGIAGLATAISLARISGIADLDIQLYEQALELREIGASIALSPNVSLTRAL